MADYLEWKNRGIHCNPILVHSLHNCELACMTKFLEDLYAVDLSVRDEDRMLYVL